MDEEPIPNPPSKLLPQQSTAPLTKTPHANWTPTDTWANWGTVAGWMSLATPIAPDPEALMAWTPNEYDVDGSSPEMVHELLAIGEAITLQPWPSPSLTL
jgi:hypothetical protein